jgi:chemotaxis protein MotA
VDVATLIGLATGIGLVIYSITAKGGTGEYFWNLPALALVLGGTLAATFVNCPLKNLVGVFGVVKNAFKRTNSGYQKIIDQFTEFSGKARKQSPISLENDLNKIDDHFMCRAVSVKMISIKKIKKRKNN